MALSGDDGGLSAVEISNFRNLEHLVVAPGSHLNLVMGANGSGKTSVLEAIYFLSRGRSFRAANSRTLIRRGCAAFRVVARLSGGGGHAPVVGVERGQRQFRARIGGRPARSLAELAELLPLLLLTPDSHRLLDAGPRHRRRFLDWGVFHHSESFLPHWKRYRRALRHRNAGLRQRASSAEVVAWDAELVAGAEGIDRARAAYLGMLEATLAPVTERLIGRSLLGLDYRRGWARGQQFAGVLNRELDGDRRLGFTRQGPHRADFVVQFEKGSESVAQLSRGQHKLLVAALMMAQARCFQDRKGRRCLLLMDDLPAELDTANRQALLGELASVPAQLFVTAIESRTILAAGAWSDAVVLDLDRYS